MIPRIGIRNESARKRFYRRDTLLQLAKLVCESEGCTGPVEISLLFCDDPYMAELNQKFRKKDGPTDVLSFPQEVVIAGDARQLGDIVISLETVERRGGNLAAHRREVGMLFCHGLLHLLGYDHATAAEEEKMRKLQAHYLGTGVEIAWGSEPAAPKSANRGGKRSKGPERERR